MRLPAYGRKLLEDRKAGKAPWLVIVAIGAVADRQTLRGQPGIARLGIPPDFDLRAADFCPLIGLDVLATQWEPADGIFTTPLPEDFHQRALLALWKWGQFGTLWSADGGRATRIDALRVRGREPVLFSGDYVPLDRRFREEVEWRRRLAILWGDGLFARAEFEPVRQRLLRELLPDHAAA